MTPFQDLSWVVPLAGPIFLALAPNQARFPHANGFLFVGRETVLLDAGIGAERIREIDRRRRIDVLVISHSHPDHILAWHELADRHLVLPRETPDSAFDLRRLGQRFTGSRENGAYWAGQMGRWIGLCPLREPEARFENDQVMEWGGARLRAIHAPGHLLDHYCFFEETTGTLLTSDVDFTGFGPWYGNPEADIAQFDADIRALAALPYVRLCSSHKPPLAGCDRSWLDRFRGLLHRQRNQVLDLCQTPRTAAQIVAASPFYHNRFPDRRLQKIFETQLVVKNLEQLVQDGQVTCSRGTYQAADAAPRRHVGIQENGKRADTL